MTEPSYVELHARSAFSFLEGASVPEELADVAAQLDLPGMAVLDRDCVSGAVRFHQAAKKTGIRSHIVYSSFSGHAGIDPLCGRRRVP